MTATRPASLALRRIACALTLSLASPVVIMPAQAQAPAPAPDTGPLPSLGESASDGLSAAQERQLGDEVMARIRPDPDYLDDPILLAYLQSLWEPLLGAARQRGNIAADQAVHGAWEIFLVRDRTVNAFALPGGYVGVHLGLISLTSSRDELAAVLAHELSHVTQRHIARNLGNQSRQTMVGLASMLLGVLAASRNPTAANAIVVGGQAVAQQGQLNFSRDMEREADRVGYGVLSGAGYSVAGMAGMFEKLDSASRLNDDQGYPWLRTHPLTTDRIAEAKSRAHTTVASAAGHPDLLHALMQGRAQVLMDPRAQSLSALASARPGPGASVTQRLAAASAATLAAARLKDTPRADAALAQVKALASADPAAGRAVAALQAEVLVDRADARRSAEALAAWGEEDSRPALWLAARAALLAGPEAQRRSAEALQGWVVDHPRDATMWSMLSQVAERLGQPLRAVRAEAEARYAMGDLPGAVERLRSGQRLGRDKRSAADAMDAAVIDSRLRELEAQLQLQRQRGGRVSPRG